MKKLYNLCIICGRFQPIHKGHEAIIRKALKMSKRVGLYIGSANKYKEKNNPLTYYGRKILISNIFQKEIKKGRLIIKPLNDRPKELYANDQSWGKYYLDNIRIDFGNPDLFVYGNDKVRSQWFTEEDLKGITEIIVDRKHINISGTQLREYIISNNEKMFRKYTNRKIWKYYKAIRCIILDKCFNKDVSETED